MEGSERVMNTKCGPRPCLWLMVPIALGFSLSDTAVTAQPTVRTAIAPQSTSAQIGGEGAKALLRSAAGTAADLEHRPALWDWTRPLSAPAKVSQAGGAASTAPAAVSQGAAAPGESADILDEVSVTATRRPTRQRDTTATTYTVKRADFQVQGARTVTDALVLIPGFEGPPSLGGVRNSGFNFLRGFDDQRFLVLRDGVSLQRSGNNRSDITRFNVDELESIEVVTGGATLRYGSGAVGGVINLITETPRGLPKLTLAYEAGSYGFSRYLAKYGGGDDTLSYNLIFASLVAFNNYPYSFTLPNQARFYGPTVNPNAAASGLAFDADGNPISSFGQPNPDPENSGDIDLYGYLKPEVGPPITVKGVADNAFNANDSYAGKLVFKPDPANKLTLSLHQQNSKFSNDGPGAYGFIPCFGGALPPGVDNGTLSFSRFLPLNPDGSESACTVTPYIVNTASVNLGINSLLGNYAAPYTTSLDGRVNFPAGSAYPNAEPATGTQVSYRVDNQTQTEAALFWDYTLTPTASINSYISYYRLTSTAFIAPLFFNTNFFGAGESPFAVFQPSQPYNEGNKLEIQSALNTQLSAGQTLSFGINFVQDRSYAQVGGGTRFVDSAISRTSAFLIDDISFSDQLKANLGFRYTYSTQFGSVGTPAVGIRYTPTNFLSLRANGSYVFNAPSIADLTVTGGFLLANPGLRPESGVTYDVGVDITPAQNLGVQVTYFNTYLDGFIGFAALIQDGNLRFQRQNQNTRIASGIEVAANWQLTDQLRLRVAYTNTDARNVGAVDSVEQSTYPYFFQFQDQSIPFNKIAAALSYANQRLNASLLFRYDDGKRRGVTGLGGSTDFTPSFATLDLNVEVPIAQNFTLTGSVFNLTDTQYEYLSGIPAPGTTFRIGGRIEFGGGAQGSN
ncbi:glr1304 [Gloeobacter violaceus PCC 7421]|uniref:Glr1304 protein n=2 Tax=Gloeobacter violaceus TaxID=33072 RepID=Q7NL22_GLOVI|nr:glr1304 [Gloeobacter violaceus PCC 7421]